MRLTLHTFLTVDGVIQAPGGPDEDPDGGFPHGGWSFPYGDENFGAAVAAWFEQADGFVLGRRTYEIFSGHWPHVTDPSDPVAGKLNALPKYVASRTLTDLSWNNSTLIGSGGSDVVAAVRKLKEQPGQELQIHGSCTFAQTLIDHGLIDEYRLLTFPVHLGTGKKLFAEGVAPGALQLTNLSSTSTGVIIATYVPAGDPQYGSYALEES